MIFALRDYLAYVRRAGRYSRDVNKSVMGGAFQGETPAKAVSLLRPGDVLLVQTLDSPVSWLIMYLTTSEISHVASYLGDGQIIHSTAGGVSIDPVESLFDHNTRVLPTQWDLSDTERAGMVESLKSNLGRPYGWAAVLTKGLMILSGRDWPYFRWHFAADIALLLLVLDLPALLLLHHPVLTWAIPAYFILIVANWMLWKIRPLKFSAWTGKPCDMLSIIQQSGGTFMFDAYQLSQQAGDSSRANP
jgi:hypothetical protein